MVETEGKYTVQTLLSVGVGGVFASTMAETEMISAERSSGEESRIVGNALVLCLSKVQYWCEVQ